MRKMEKPRQKIFTPEGIKEFKEREIRAVNRADEKFKTYWEKYLSGSNISRLFRTQIDNIMTLNPMGIYLYETKNNEKKRMRHAIWIYKNLKGIGIYESIPQEEWQDLVSKPEVIEKINTLIVESYNQVVDFYPWKQMKGERGGFVIERNRGCGMSPLGFAGIRINYNEHITPLKKAIELKDEQKIRKEQKHITASFVHEFTHIERDDGISFGGTADNEMVSHIAQFIFDPKENEIFNQQLNNSLDNIKKTRTAGEKLGVYDKAQYIALLLLVHKLSKESESIQSALKLDKDPSKVEALRRMRGMIEEPELKIMREKLKEFMEAENDQLIAGLPKIEEELGISDKISLRK